MATVSHNLCSLVPFLTLYRRAVLATLYERHPGSNSRSHLRETLSLGWMTGERVFCDNGRLHLEVPW